MSFWTSTLRRGRKAHQCENCGRPIPKGEQSYVEAGTVDGDFNSYRSCVPCHDLVQRLYVAGVIDSEGYQFEWLPELAEEAGEQWPPSIPLPAIGAGDG